MARETLVVVEDDEDIRELVRYNLAKEGYRVLEYSRGEDALRQMEQSGVACILLDLMLPGMDGFEVARAVRSNPQLKNTPIVMLTAKGEDSDVVAGLELGADDYIVKPFSPRVLVARVRAVLRRRRAGKPSAEASPIDAGGIGIHPGRREVSVGGQVIDLTHSEFQALHYLASRPGWVFSRAQIIEAVHGPGYPVTDRSVDVLIVGLRRKLGDAGSAIETVRGTGYRFRQGDHREE